MSSGTHALHVLLYHLQCSLPDGCRMKDDTPGSTTSGNSNQKESRLVIRRRAGWQILPKTPYVKEEDFSQKPLAFPQPGLHRTPSLIQSLTMKSGSMTGLDQSTMLPPSRGVQSLPWNMPGEGAKQQDSSPRRRGWCRLTARLGGNQVNHNCRVYKGVE